ncbi:hypothetical protein L218DRAFT_1007959 [Marasmius fiardii PR-910]|nr:hypothetical protein L218DRAFT_1007959 [Marasmius fiardii PR-910]
MDEDHCTPLLREEVTVAFDATAERARSLAVATSTLYAQAAARWERFKNILIVAQGFMNMIIIVQGFVNMALLGKVPPPQDDHGCLSSPFNPFPVDHQVPIFHNTLNHGHPTKHEIPTESALDVLYQLHCLVRFFPSFTLLFGSETAVIRLAHIYVSIGKNVIRRSLNPEDYLQRHDSEAIGRPDEEMMNLRIETGHCIERLRRTIISADEPEHRSQMIDLTSRFDE